MAGNFVKYTGGIACESLQTYDVPTSSGGSATISVPTYYNTDGTARSIIYEHYNYGAYQESPYSRLTPIATSDNYADYSINDYSIDTDLTTTQTQSRNYSEIGAFRTFTVTATNNTEDTIEWSCVKFYKSLYYSNGSSANSLICGYFLENPVTLAPNESATINIVFTVGTADQGIS